MLVMWTRFWLMLWMIRRNKQKFISCTRSTRVHLRMLQTANCLRSIKSQSGLSLLDILVKASASNANGTHTTIQSLVYSYIFVRKRMAKRHLLPSYIAFRMWLYAWAYMCSASFHLCSMGIVRAHSFTLAVANKYMLVATDFGTCTETREKHYDTTHSLTIWLCKSLHSELSRWLC